MLPTIFYLLYTLLYIFSKRVILLILWLYIIIIKLYSKFTKTFKYLHRFSC